VSGPRWKKLPSFWPLGKRPPPSFSPPGLKTAPLKKEPPIFKGLPVFWPLLKKSPPGWDTPAFTPAHRIHNSRLGSIERYCRGFHPTGNSWCHASVSGAGCWCTRSVSARELFLRGAKNGTLLKIGGSFFREAYFRPGVQKLGWPKNQGGFFLRLLFQPGAGLDCQCADRARVLFLKGPKNGEPFCKSGRSFSGGFFQARGAETWVVKKTGEFF